MTVRDGFWEELSQDIPVACQHRRRLIFFRVAAAASVLLVLAASSATFWYLSPKEEMEEAFTKIVVANSGRMDGDGVRANQLPTAMEPVLPKPAPKSFGLLSQCKICQRDRQRFQLRFSHQHQRERKFIPGIQKAQNNHGRKNRFGYR